MSLLDGLLLDPYRDPREVWIAVRTDGVKGSGTQSDPYDASTQQRFDELMLNMPAYTTVHLGPGEFQTIDLKYGIDPNPPSWQVKSGQKIIGSGMGLTTMKLVGASVSDRHYVAIGVHYYNYVEDVEISDLTVDCNIAGQPNQNVACGAIAVPGRHIRIRRVRAINFSSQTTFPVYVENFVISLGATHPNLDETGKEGADCVIEDCIVERPGANPVHNSFCLHFSGGERQTDDGWMSYFRGCVIRNCLVNTQIVYGTLVPLPIADITYAAGVVTVTSKAPHLLTKPGNLVIRGVTADDSSNNPFNGVFEIESVESPTKVTYKLVTSAALDTGNPNKGFTGGGVFSHSVSIERIDPVAGLTFKVTTREPHNRTKINNVLITGVGIKDALDPTIIIPSTTYNGSFAVVDYDPAKPKEIQIALATTPETTDPTQIALGSAFMNGFHIALGGDGGTGTVVEGNRVFHCSNGGPYNDTWSSKDLVIRDNYYHDVLTGPSQSLSGISTTSDPIPLASLGFIGTKAIATTDFPHGFVTNDRVTIVGASVPLYNGLRIITDVPNPREFRYELGEQPSAAASGTPGYFTHEIEIEGILTIVNQRRLESLTKFVSNGKYFARAKQATYVKNGLEVGHWVRITKAGHAYYNGAKELTAVSDPAQATPSNPQTFEYALQGDPGIDSSNGDFSAGYFGRIWQTRRLVIENNEIDLSIRPLAGDYGHAAGIYYAGTNAFYPPAHSFLHFVIRANVFRNLNDSSAPTTRAMEVYGCQKPIIEHNIIGVDRSPAITHSQDGEVRTFNNLTPAGALVPSVAVDTPPTPVTEVSSKVRAELEEAMVMRFMEL